MKLTKAIYLPLIASFSLFLPSCDSESNRDREIEEIIGDRDNVILTVPAAFVQGDQIVSTGSSSYTIDFLTDEFAQIQGEQGDFAGTLDVSSLVVYEVEANGTEGLLTFDVFIEPAEEDDLVVEDVEDDDIADINSNDPRRIARALNKLYRAAAGAFTDIHFDVSNEGDLFLIETIGVRLQSGATLGQVILAGRDVDLTTDLEENDDGNRLTISVDFFASGSDNFDNAGTVINSTFTVN